MFGDNKVVSYFLDFHRIYFKPKINEKMELKSGEIKLDSPISKDSKI